MKRFYTLLIMIWFGSYAAQANDTTTFNFKAIQQLYLGFGTGGTFTNASNFATIGQNFSLNISATLANNFVIRAGLLPVQAYTKTYASTLSPPAITPILRILDSNPYHKLQTYYLAFGKRKKLSKSFQCQAQAALSYTKFTEVVEFKSNGPEIFYHLYADKIHHKPGLLLQTEAMFLPTRFAGLTLGGYYHYVPKISNAGFTLSLNLGLLK